MESAVTKKSSKKVKVGVRTVADVEVGATAAPASPPATEQDRAEFQKLLLQMNGVTVNQRDGGSNKKQNLKDKNPVDKNASTPQNLSGDNVGPLNDSDKQTAQKKKRGKRSEKKSNKPSPTDNSLKTASVDDKSITHNPAASKRDEQLRIEAQNIAQAIIAAKPIPDSNADSAKVPKSFQNAKAPNKVLHGAAEQRVEPPKGNIDDSEPLQLKQRESALKRPPMSGRDHSNSVNREMRGCKPRDEHARRENGESSALHPSERQPLIFLQAALNLIKPKRQINAQRDSNAFFCIPCDKEFSDIEKHLDKSRDNHFFKWKCEMRRRTIDLLPTLSPKHISLLDSLVMSTVEQCKMPEEQQIQARSLWQNLAMLAKNQFKDYQVRWFGSQVNGLALSDNKVLNMDLYVQNKEEAAASFLHFIAAVEETVKDVERVVATNFAHANIYHRPSGMVVQLSLNNSGAYHTSKLICDYISIDCRVQPLCIFFRHWGKICGVDQGENGSWQGHAFPIMVIHFLQQRRILPVLHDMVDNPEGHPEIYLDPKELKGCWSTRNKDSIGKLVFDMFRYYAIEHDVVRHVVCITQLEPFLRQDTKWNAKRIAVIDPFQPKHNISRYISANMYDYVHFCLVTTACALGIPRSEAGPLFGYICPRPDRLLFDPVPAVLEEYLEATDKIHELVLRLDSSYNVPDLRMDNEVKAPSLRTQLVRSSVFSELLAMKVVPMIPGNCEASAPQTNAYATWWVTPHQSHSLAGKFNLDAFKLSFSKYLCTDNEVPPLTCTSCHKNGHLRSKCPDEVIPKMGPVAPPSKELDSLLNQLCIEVFETRCSEDRELLERMEIRDDLLHWLQQYYHDLELHLFGSSLNGFGGRSSDIDMCLTFQSNATGEGLNFPSLVEEIQARLKGHKSIQQLVAITTAKVPIVKFSYGRKYIQIDISLYNRLGIMNTQLLKAYSVIDPRVRPLVYMMKYLAKTTGIGDASRGSLSSYAYSLMSLYFLQQVEPPIIPVLQELHDPNAGPKVEIVDGANVYFFRHVDKLDTVWPHVNKNKSSLGELWLQLLEFYASEKFHNSQRVVSIRKKDPLYKFDKLWTSTNLCIEDPFDLNHNLGSGLSKRMNIFIVKTFQKACRHFSSIPKMDKISSLEKYYFNENALSVGKPPSDRGCHFCRSIGHQQKDCPKLHQLQQKLGAPRSNANNWGNRMNKNFDNNFRDRPGRGDRRDLVRDNHQRMRDPGRISNMPMPIGMPMAMQMQNAPPHLRNSLKPMNQQNQSRPPNMQNHSKPMNIQNHVVVGSMRPPGFPALPPGYPLLGPPVRAITPQMAPQMPPQMAPQMAPQMPPQMAPQPARLIQGPAPFLMARPPRPFHQWQ